MVLRVADETNFAMQLFVNDMLHLLKVFVYIEIIKGKASVKCFIEKQ